MKKTIITSKTIKYIAIYAIAFITYNLSLFALCGFGGHGTTFWISYVFMLIAFFDVAVVTSMLGATTTLPKDWLFGYPIVRHMTIYVASELFLSIAFMISDTYKMNWSIALVAQMLLFAIHLIFIISCFLAKEIVEDIQEKVKVETTDFRLLQIDVEMIAKKATDEETKQAFKKLAEKIRYSDPMKNVLYL